MSGIAVISKTDVETIMIRLIHNGSVIDRIEVDKVFYKAEDQIENNEKEVARNLWEEGQ